MIKLECTNGKVSAEMEGNILEISEDFDHAVNVSLDEIGKKREEAGLCPVGEGALESLAILVSQYIAKESGAAENPFALLVKADEIKASIGRIKDFIKSEIDAFNIDEIEEIPLGEGLGMLLDLLFGIDEDKPEQPEGEANGTE